MMRRATCIALLLAAASPVAAQVDIQQLRPTADLADHYISAQSARPAWETRASFGVVLNHGQAPLVVRRDGERDGDIVGAHGTAHLLASAAFFRIWELGIDLPLVLYQTGDDRIAGFADDELASGGFGVGDLRLSVRAVLWSQERRDERRGASLAFAVDGWFPTGDETTFQGEGWRAEPRLLFDYALEGGYRIHAESGWLFREASRYRNVEIDDVLTWRVAGNLPITDDVHLVPEVDGAVALLADELGAEESPVELLFGGRWFLDRWVVLGAVGTGVVPGFASPDWRVMIGGGWRTRDDPEARTTAAPRRTRDRCPGQPEDIDGFEDDDGCPDPDNDEDGILDVDDHCPDRPETVDGFADDDGCPDPDDDRDGIPDEKDPCPLVPEDHDGFEDTDGCPEPDNDGDGFSDVEDQCPDGAETENGWRDTDGCPDEKPLGVTCERIELLGRNILFDVGEVTIQSASLELVGIVADTLGAYPDLIRVRVEGHTDDRGDDAANLELSQQRVESVRDALIARGVSPLRLEAVGYGETKPVASNGTAEGRARNRRVEFIVIEREGCPARE